MSAVQKLQRAGRRQIRGKPAVLQTVFQASAKRELLSVVPVLLQ